MQMGELPEMITVKNALVHALDYLKTQQAGHCMSMPARVTDALDEMLGEWCQRNGLAWSINDKTLTLRLLADGENYIPPDPTIPPVGTPLNKLHPGNRLRLMMGQPFLPEGNK